MIGISVITYNIPKRTVDRYKKYINKVNQDFILEEISKKDECHIFKSTIPYFSKALGCNTAINKLAEKGCDIIICTDVDCIIPYELVEKSQELIYKDPLTWHFAYTRNIQLSNFSILQKKELLKYKVRRSGTGAYNAASVGAWKKIGGWNENLYGWGGADNDLHARVKFLGLNFVTTKNYPLMHINHEKRKFKTYQKRSILNRNISKKMIEEKNFPQWLKFNP